MTEDYVKTIAEDIKDSNANQNRGVEVEDSSETEKQMLTMADIEGAEKKLAEKQAQLEEREKEIETTVEQLVARETEYQRMSSNLQTETEALHSTQVDLAHRELYIHTMEKNVKTCEQQVIQREAAVAERERAMASKEQSEDVSFQKKRVEERAALESELAEEQVAALKELSDFLAQERQSFEASLYQREKEFQTALDGQSNSKLAAAEKRAKEIATHAEKAVQQEEDELAKRATELDKREKDLNIRESKADTADKEWNGKKRRQDTKETELEWREENVQSEVKDGMAEKAENYKAQIKAKDDALKELREHVSSLEAQVQMIETFKVSLGNDPSVIENKMLNLNRTIEILNEELATRAPREIQDERDKYRDQCTSQKSDIEELEKENSNLTQKNGKLSRLELVNIELKSKNQELESLLTEIQSQNEKYQQRIERLSSTEARLCDRDQRLAEINKGYLAKLVGSNQQLALSEIDWLQNMCKQCDAYGIHFPQRILYAFHTALKISDWSSITVLAGVSGTGKSELPKLYAAFGGLNFISVPVQPSWDSQESMLGFFNSIDNRFEPEPLLRFLVQCTENDEFNKYMSIVLLDEMNLAYVEHYFADFLSKLETRRGTNRNNVPTVEVKLGAGVEPYQLKLKRSVLWTGTMNQDETTKSLSDKVIDRGLVINFPRPRTLLSRNTMGILEAAVEKSGRPMLTTKDWGSWIIRTVDLQGDQLKELDMYKKIVEDINNELEHVGRALGHRVWQAIEYYIINYPTVAEEMRKLAPGEMSTKLQEAMKTAFEDQIVQKIMPKLRGVETRGRGKENLEKIEALLENKGFDHLKDDFEIACERGYGQFIWSSAKYIEADEANIIEASVDSAEEVSEETASEAE